MGKMIKKSMLIIALIGVSAMVWNSHVLATQTLTTDATGRIGGGGWKIVRSGTVLTLVSTVPPGAWLHSVVVKLYGNSAQTDTVGAVDWYVRDSIYPTSVTKTFTLDDIAYAANRPLPDREYWIRYQYRYPDPDTGNYVYSPEIVEKIYLYNGSPSSVLSVGDPNFQDPDGSYTITEDTDLTVTCTDYDPAVSYIYNVRINLLGDYNGTIVLGSTDIPTRDIPTPYSYPKNVSITRNLNDLAYTSNRPLVPGTYYVAFGYHVYIADSGLPEQRTWNVRKVVLDDGAPRVTITHPQDGATLNSAVVTVSANILEDSDAVVTAAINPVVLDYDPSTGVASGQVLHTLKDFTITVTAEDALGQKGTDTVTIEMQHDRGLHKGN